MPTYEHTLRRRTILLQAPAADATATEHAGRGLQLRRGSRAWEPLLYVTREGGVGVVQLWTPSCPPRLPSAQMKVSKIACVYFAPLQLLILCCNLLK